MRTRSLTNAEHGSSDRRDTWLRTAAGIGQLTLGTWLLVAWLVQAPSGITVSLIVASFLLVLASLIRWRWR